MLSSKMTLIFSTIILIFHANIAFADTPWCSIKPHYIQDKVGSSYLNRVKKRSPNPLRVVHTEGTLPNQGIRSKSAKARRDMPIMSRSALYWRMTGDNTWLDLSKKYLIEWMRVYRPSYNPIDENRLIPLFSTYAIIKDQLSSSERKNIAQKLRRWGYVYIKKMHSSDISNWQSQRIAIVSSIALSLDNKKMFDEIRPFFKKQVSKNISANGVTYDFKKRDALHYAIYDLEPLVEASLVARQMGENWYSWTSKNGSSVKKGIEWILPYAKGEKTHQEFKNAKGFDAARAKAGVKGFSGQFKPESAGYLIWLASSFDHSLRPLAEQLRKKEPKNLLLCGH